MSLIAMVQDKLVYREKLIREDLFNELLSLALLMPGPVAVNLISLIGFVVRGPIGALVSFVCIITPAFVCITILYFLFDSAGSLSILVAFKGGLLTVIASVVFISGVRMAKKKIQSNLFPLVIVGFILLLFFHDFWHILILILICALVGWLKYKVGTKGVLRDNTQLLKSSIGWPLASITFFLMLFSLSWQNVYVDIMFTFSRVSLTLVGGGYVIIPILQDIVAQKQWLSATEFWDAIAIGQLCPGPVLISSAIVGFKNAGFLGGLLATISIFAPAAIVIITVFHAFKDVLKHQSSQAVSEGLAMAIIALIFYSGITIGATIDRNVVTVTLFLSAALLQLTTKINSGLLIVSGGIVNVIGFLIFNQ